jgi:hypothetical protein
MEFKMKYMISLLLAVLLFSCENGTEVKLTSCPEKLIYDTAMYNHGFYDSFAFDSVWIEGDCLKANVLYGGGCGDILFQMYWDGAVMESYPVQVRLKLSFMDNDLCKALMHKDLAYDISMLKVGGSNHKVIIHVDGWDESLIYNY